MAMKTDETTIHELTRAEIARQIGLHAARRREIVAERAEIYAAGAHVHPESLSVDERAARAHAKLLLNGSAPASLTAPAGIDFASLDRQLLIEERGIDIALKILGEKELLARAAEAVQWAQDHADRWRALVRETILANVKLDALKHAASQMLDQCIDVAAINLPMVNVIGCEWTTSMTPDDLIEAGLKAGIVSQRDVDKAKNV
jgi:hypothetical protein